MPDTIAAVTTDLSTLLRTTGLFNGDLYGLVRRVDELNALAGSVRANADATVAAIGKIEELTTDVADLETRVAALEAAGPPPDPLMWNYDFTDTTKTVKVGNAIQYQGVPIFGIEDSNYGAGNKISSYNKPALVDVTSEGIRLRANNTNPGKTSSDPWTVADGGSYTFSGAFCGGRAVSHYLPLFHRVEFDVRIPRYAEVWCAVWHRLNSAYGGATYAEIDDFEMFTPQIYGDRPQFAIAHMNPVNTTLGMHKNWYDVPDDGGFHHWVTEIRPAATGGGMEVECRVDGGGSVGGAKYAAAPTSGGEVYKMTAAQRTTLENQCAADPSKSWDIAFDIWVGGDYFANPNIVFPPTGTNTIRNWTGSAWATRSDGKAKGPRCKSWRDSTTPQQAEMIVKNFTALDLTP